MMRHLTFINEETLNQWVAEYKLLSNKPLYKFLVSKGLTVDDSGSISKFICKINNRPHKAHKLKQVIKG